MLYYNVIYLNSNLVKALNIGNKDVFGAFPLYVMTFRNVLTGANTVVYSTDISTNEQRAYKIGVLLQDDKGQYDYEFSGVADYTQTAYENRTVIEVGIAVIEYAVVTSKVEFGKAKQRKQWS